MAQLVKQIIDIVVKKPERRTDLEIEAVLPWLRRRTQVLRQQDHGSLMDIVRNCHYEMAAPDEVILRQGERGDCLYIILRGTVSVYIDASLTGEEESSPLPASPTRETDGEGTSPGNIRRRHALERTGFGKFIVRYGSGKSFGEVALISEDKIRNATIVTEDHCDFMVIGKELFNRNLKAYEERAYAESRKFVHSHPFFSNLSAKFKRLLELSFRKETHGFEAKLVEQGDPVCGLHFITKGQANILMQPSRHHKQYPNMWPFEAGIDLYSIEFDWLRESRKNAILRKYRDPAVIATKPEHVAIRRTEGYAAVEKMMQEKTICLCGVQDGEVIGDTEIVLNLPTYHHTVVCTAETDVFVLDLKNFERFAGKRNHHTLEIIKMNVEWKLRMRKQLRHGRDIPLLQFLHFKMTETILPSSKKLPPLKLSKAPPDKEVEKLYLLERFREGKAPLVEPHVPGALYYRDLMQEKARIRDNIRRRAKPTLTDRSRDSRRAAVRRQPRSRRAIVESLQEMLEADLLMFRPRKKKTTSTTESTKTESIYSGRSSRKTTLSRVGKKSGSANSLQDSEHGEKIRKPNRSTDSLHESERGSKDSSSNDSKSLLGTLGVGQCNEGRVQGTPSPHLQDQNIGLITETKPVIISLPPIREDTREQMITRKPTEISDNQGDTKIRNDLKETKQTDDGHAQATADNGVAEPVVETNDVTGDQLHPVPPSEDRSKVTPHSKWEPALRFVNERIHDRFTTQLLEKDPSYADYETSENTLSFLESRIRSFHIKYGERNKMTLKLPKLRRYKAVPQDHGQPLPRPGGKVWIRKRLCRFADSKVQVKGHQHVRYHMTDSLPDFDTLRKTQVIMNFLLPKNSDNDDTAAKPVITHQTDIS